MKQHKRNMIFLCLFYLISFFSFTIPFAYMQTFLEFVGYDVLERGVILSGSAVVAIIAQFLFGYLCDKFKQIKRFFYIAMIIFILSSLVMYQITTKQFFLHLIFVSLVGGIFRTVNALQDSWTLETDDYCKDRFGPIRAFGALGWMIGTPIGAIIIEHYGYSILGYVFAGLSIFTFLITMFMKDATKEEHGDAITMRDLKELLENKAYVLIVTIFLFIQVIAIADIYTTVDKMMMLGASENLIGARWSIQAMMELPLFFAGAYLLKRFKAYPIMIFGTIMYMIRFMAYAFVHTPEGIIVVSLLQCVTFPLIMVSSKPLIDDVTPKHLRSSGQTIASAFYNGVSLLITPVLAGFLISSFNIDVTLFIFGALGVIPILLSFFYRRLEKK